MGYSLRAVRSEDAGATWIALAGNFGRGGAGAADEWATAVKFATANLTAGTSYRFGGQILRDSGTADATASRCDTFVQLFPR
jgi:hypothetical protein